MMPLENSLDYHSKRYAARIYGTAFFFRVFFRIGINGSLVFFLNLFAE